MPMHGRKAMFPGQCTVHRHRLRQAPLAGVSFPHPSHLMQLLRELLKVAVARGASDLHIKPGRAPALRIKARLSVLDTPPIPLESVREMISSIIPQYLKRRFDIEHEADFSLKLEGVGRFRTNVFLCSGEPAITLRHVKTDIPTFEELHLPQMLKELALLPRGIIMATGTTGSGKSTTLAAMIEHINQNRRCRIITVEDPVEYVFQDKQSVISQREVGLDTMSFHAALKHVLRQDPDVIMIGEMRDSESSQAALTSAETGHLVFTTLHTGSAAQSVSRILDFFPHTERDQVRMALA
ncbi:MAG TPA: PilT/PilU family type 4a pilus ATPase, partial [Kiritimatiellae bacterium]|nr:PilT/PilU family type 4a pilus ATPase [Kiritimatiellia bacterium]